MEIVSLTWELFHLHGNCLTYMGIVSLTWKLSHLHEITSKIQKTTVSQIQGNQLPKKSYLSRWKYAHKWLWFCRIMHMLCCNVKYKATSIMSKHIENGVINSVSLSFIQDKFTKLLHNCISYCTTPQLHLTKPELRFCTGSNPAHSMSEIEMVRISDNGPGWK